MTVLSLACLLASTVLRWPTPTREMKPWVYNWWMGSAVDARGLECQCRELAGKGFGGFHVIPIYGAKGGYEKSWKPFLSSEWIEAWNLAVRTAREHDLRLKSARPQRYSATIQLRRFFADPLIRRLR